MEKLGRGGMATVYKAYHANLDRYVAIKVLHPAFMEDPNFLARFEREARVVAKLEHPNIIPVYDFAEHEGQPYLVMKFVEGETLKAKLQRKPLTPDEGVVVIQAVGEGLAYAHKQGILHRDVKPSNVMMAYDGQIFLTDFGLARIASRGESTLSSDMMIGTPQYISPEQAMGKRDLDEGTDIYSFGVLVYELVVGKVPFISDTPFSIIHDHIYTPLPLPRAVNKSVPEVIERLLLKALAKERNDRFASVDEMVTAFKKGISGEELPEAWVDPTTYTPPPVAPVPGTPTPAPVPAPGVDATAETLVDKPKKKRRWWIPAVIALFLCICIFIAFNILKDQEGQLGSLGTNGPPQTQDSGGPPPGDPGGKDLERELEKARTKVEENPDYPLARLELAGVLLQMGEMEEARTEYEKGAELAGTDPTYFVQAGDLFNELEFWMESLVAYTTAIDLGTEFDSTDFQRNFRETLYFVSIKPEIEPNLFPDEFGADSPQTNYPPFFVAQARFTLYHRDANEALSMIEEVFSNYPDRQFPEAELVHAEILIKLGSDDEARELLKDLTSGPSPQWVKLEARRLLEMIRE
jgi:serine/threonine protein kinase